MISRKEIFDYDMIAWVVWLQKKIYFRALPETTYSLPISNNCRHVTKRKSKNRKIACFDSYFALIFRSINWLTEISLYISNKKIEKTPFDIDRSRQKSGNTSQSFHSTFDTVVPWICLMQTALVPVICKLRIQVLFTDQKKTGENRT